MRFLLSTRRHPKEVWQVYRNSARKGRIDIALFIGWRQDGDGVVLIAYYQERILGNDWINLLPGREK